MTPEAKQALAHLAGWLRAFDPIGRTRREFWREFNERSQAVEAMASAPDADPGLREAYYEIVDAAHQGYGGPEELADEVMS